MDQARSHHRYFTSELKWAKRAMWAPGVISKDEKYYLLFAANDVHEGEIGGIGVKKMAIKFSIFSEINL